MTKKPKPNGKPKALNAEEAALSAHLDKMLGKMMAAGATGTAKPIGGAGRPPKYRAIYATQAEKMCRLGATDMELADFFTVDVRTIYRWKVESTRFCQALKNGKEYADARVERSLYQKAVGYEHHAVKIFMPAGATEPVYAPYVEHHPPDATAIIFWLKNRKSQEWRDKHTVEHEVPDFTMLKTEELLFLKDMLAKWPREKMIEHQK